MIHFIFGVLIGGIIGVVVLSCCIVAGQDDPCRDCKEDRCDECRYWRGDEK